MSPNQQQADNSQAVKSDTSQAPVAVPTLSLPKGGGAIRGIGEKFAANPVTGTGSMTVPIATSPGRSGFGPQLSLSYDSGAGNGPFGFGWSLSLPAITRKTDKGLPQYLDANESDVFILSGAEDLVPAFKKDATGKWILKDGKHVILDEPRTVDGVTYRVRHYRPRIEGLFARIERWSNVGDPGDVHWRSISKDNVLTLYGKDDNSRIVDLNVPHRIFTWLICETRDDKGNAVLYEYKPEDGVGIDLTQAHEHNRGKRDDLRRATNRYLKHIRYGNRVPLLDNEGQRPRVLTDEQIQKAGWMFEVVFDYGEHDADAPKPNDAGQWTYRSDPFSSYRAGFEVRTGRLCQRVLMFHHFENEAEIGKDCLVRSTSFTYSHKQDPANALNPIYTFLLAVTQTGYKRHNGGYLKRSLPPVEYEYTQPIVQDTVHEVDAASLENLPIGVDGAAYQWTDLHGEGIPGILTEQAGVWFYKRNISPISKHPVAFAPLERVATKPNLALAGGQAQFMDLAGDGQPDLVVLDGPMPGLYEHDSEEGWKPFRPFTSRLNRDTHDPNLKFVDLDGDGHTDVLISEDDAFVWHPSLAEEGFGSACRVHQALDEEQGPHLVFADGTQSIYLADLSGDGLTDLVRIRNGEVCYWPNLGYGQFAAKVTMDNAPHFDHPDQFDHKRIRLADIDGTGTTDIMYLHRNGVRLYFNQSGNSWSVPQLLHVFPRVDDVVAITPTDLLGNGTACLVWSSPLPGDARRQMRYVDLMGGQKPHLLVKTVNNLGAETRVEYSPSTKFYLQDKRDGQPWITRLPFPVHVVERVDTYDHISRNRFVTRYKYHHGYFDGAEREFRGFGMVEQLDTEEFAVLTEGGTLPEATNLDAASHVPPVLTKTWFHTGVSVGRDHISDFFAGLLDDNDKGEYYREPGLTDAQARALLLPDTVLLAGLTPEEEREASRALKGSMLRQEIYALDNTDKTEHPYTVAEQNFTVERLQPKGDNRHAIFFTHAREVISYHYERNPADPRVSHTLTLEVDSYGNMLKSLAVGYGRRPGQSPLQGKDKEKQEQVLITYMENDVTNAIDAQVSGPNYDPNNYRTPLPSETRSYEVTGFDPAGDVARFSFDDFAKNGFQPLLTLSEIKYEEPTDYSKKQKRLIEHVRTLYRPDDLGVSQNDPLTLLPLGIVHPLALPGESYKLAFTRGLARQIFVDSGKLSQVDLDSVLANEGKYVHSEGDNNWWIPSGRMFYSPDADNDASTERAYARQHFFLPHRYRDPFHTNAVSAESIVTYDGHNLLMVESRDPLGNVVTVKTQDDDGSIAIRNDYRVLQPYWVTDPNRNRTQVAFDALGMVVATAVMGKPGENEGDNLVNFKADLTQTQIDTFHDALDPHALAVTLLKGASTRIVYDLHRFRLSQQAHPEDSTQWEPPYAAILARETHASDPLPPQGLKIQISFSYSDGFGREIQKKIQAEPGEVEGEDTVGNVTLIDTTPNLRWVSSGWTIFNNKGKPVRQYEPFFSTHHQFQFEKKVGVSPILFYDPVERVVTTLHPNHTYEKVVFDPWRQTTYDVNDTVIANGTETGDPRTDLDIKGYIAEHFKTQPNSWQTWHQQRITGAKGTQEKSAAEKAAKHANTPTTAHFDSLGRPFLTLAHNGFKADGTTIQFPTRVKLDIEGNQREVRDAIEQNGDKLGRKVMDYDYDMLGNRIHQASMEAGLRWMLNDVMGKPIRAWDSRSHTFRTEYDTLRRPLRSFVTGADPANPNLELLTERLVYGEQHPQDKLRNLRGRLYLHLDQAGAVTNEAHDFKSNLLGATRRLAQEYKQAINWSTINAAIPADSTTKFTPSTLEAALAPQLEADSFTSRTTYDALNRPTQLIAPHSDQPGTKVNVIQPIYNEANLLKQVYAWLNQNAEPAGWLDPATANLHAVTDINYDAKGQRTWIDHATQDGKLISTSYAYDRETFRLTHLYTRRGVDPLTRQGAAFTDDCDNPQPPPPTIAAPENPPQGKSCGLQNLHYIYDPIGNITHIRDDAQQTIYFRNKRVEPSADYTYDAIYRLIEATGREHLGQNGGGNPLPASAPNYNDKPHVGLLHPGDGNVMGTYLEQYQYNEVGNFVKMFHRGSDPVGPGWTRAYAYNEDSQLEPGKKSNRLTSTIIGNITEAYGTKGNGYDPHGNMLSMPHLQVMQWDFKDQLCMTQRQKVNNEDEEGIQRHGERTYYVYDAAGQRVRKVTELATGQAKDERIYLGGFEIYRKNGANPLVRETIHIMDDKQRIALVETRTQGNDPAPQQLIRYQFGNHLGSASLELDHQAQIVSYEEYTPYGSTSYQVVCSQTETPKRYRYTGKERDEESGLYYHGARYYAPWLGRWTSADPVGIADTVNSYVYVRCNPIMHIDPNGEFSKKTYDDWLSNSISSQENDIASKRAALNKNELLKTSEQEQLSADELRARSLEKQRSTIAAQRKPLESKKTKLTKAEAAQLKTLKKQNTDVVKQLNAVRKLISQIKSHLIKLDSTIHNQETALAESTANLGSLKQLKMDFDEAYHNATSSHPKADVELLTDIVMNEARDNSVEAKDSIAYAYPHDKANHMKAGHVTQPPKSGPGSIDNYHAGVTEERFNKSIEKNVAGTYIRQVIDSLESVNKRLTDATDTNDPTQGATNWSSPGAPGQKKKFPPSGIPGYARKMQQIIVPGVPPDVFTFYKNKKQ